jgi:hypothetical protein
VLSTALASINDNYFILLLVVLPTLPFHFPLIRVDLLYCVFLLFNLVFLPVSTLTFGMDHFLNLPNTFNLFLLLIWILGKSNFLRLEGLGNYFILELFPPIVHLFYSFITCCISGWRCRLLRRMESEHLRRYHHFTLLVFDLLLEKQHLLPGVGITSRVNSRFTFDFQTRDGLLHFISLILRLIGL